MRTTGHVQASATFGHCMPRRPPKRRTEVTIFPGIRVVPLVALLLAFSLHASETLAQAPSTDTRPAFSLASGAIGSSRERPALYLTFRRVTHLDFRIYRVNDPMKFLVGLKDPHQLGSEEPPVDQEPTLLERVASWKAARRDDIRSFFRAQFTRDYRAARRRRVDQQQVALRQTLRVNSFAQVPLLNPSQLVTSWRELLPPVRDSESRRIPLDLTEPGMYVVEAVFPPYKAYTVVLVSDVAVVSKAAPGQLLLFAANRFSGQPVPRCDVQVIGGQQVLASGVTGDDGTFAVDLRDASPDEVVAVTRCGREVAATDPGGWYLRAKPRDLVGYIYTDKPIYRPGHTVRFKAVLRWRSRDALVPFDRPQVEIRLTDPTDKVVLRETRTVDAFGAVDGSWQVPSGAALGYYALQVVSEDDEASGSFEVQEYRKPEYEVRVASPDRFLLQGRPLRVTIDARYYFGQPVARGKVKWVVHRQPYYSPLRWSDDDEVGESSWWSDEEGRSGDARLDDKGIAEIAIPTDTDENGRDYSLRVEARVTDAGGREVAGSTIVHATYGPLLVVATQDEYVKRPGAASTLSVRVLDYQGTPQPGKTVSVWLEQAEARVRWDKERRFTVVSEGVVTTDDQGRATWTTRLPEHPGDYRLKAAVRAGDRLVQDDAYVWVSGGRQEGPEYTGDRYLELIADKRTYQPGETARFLVRGDDVDAPVLVTKEGQHVAWHRVVRARSNEALEVPITEEDLGDTWVNIAFLRDDRLFRAEKRVSVPATARQLQVVVTASEPRTKPRQPATFVVTTTDQDGSPVRAQVSLGVIDEAVYGVKPDATPDPLRFFYRREYSQVGTQFSREYSFVGYSGTQAMMLARFGRRAHGLADFKGERPQPQVRKDFPDAIFWSASLVTNEQGRAEVRVTYPDALTTWRLTARAVTADTRVGSGVARTTTTKDLIVRAITPRFLTERDTAIVPVVTHNYLPDQKSVSVALSATGLTPAADAAQGPRTVVIPSGAEDRQEWTFTAESAGAAAITASATTTGDADAVELAVPVLPFGVKFEASRNGSILAPGEHAVALDIPAETNPRARTIRVALAPSMAGSILGALDFLTSYPYGCTEQILSSYLPTLIVSRTLAQLGLTPTERLRLVDRQVTAGVRRLLDQQHDDGGWGWWKTDENHPFMTAYAVFGLLETRANGYKVDEWRIRQGTQALAALYAKYPRAVPALKAYMTYVMVRAGSALEGADDQEGFDAARAMDELWNARDRLTAYGRSLLLLTLDLRKDARGDRLARELLSEVTQTGDLAYWKVDSDPLLDDWADTSVEATATAVHALVARDPRNPVLEAAVRYLLVNRSEGTYWGSTKQTAMVIYGLLEYMKARREAPAPFSVEVLVNGRPAGTASFTPQSLTTPEPTVLTAPAREGRTDIVIRKQGEGALYWSATAQFYDTRSPIERTGSRRLAIVRQYFSLSPVVVKGHTVYRETPFSGTARPGDVLLVRIAVAGSPDWRYLMIEDPLAAGTEPIADDDLYALERRSSSEWWMGRREFRDDRAVFFRDRLVDGRMDLHYLLKVTTPGTFHALPARVSPMYVPGVSATSDVQGVAVPSSGGGTE